MTITDLKDGDIIRYNYGASDGSELDYYEDSSGNIVLKDADYGNFIITLKGVTDISQVSDVIYEGVDATKTLGEIFSVSGGGGDDPIDPEEPEDEDDITYLESNYTTLTTYGADDTINNSGHHNVIYSGAGNDSILIVGWMNDDEDAFTDTASYSYADSGEGNDTINNLGGGIRTTLIGGDGNDYISSSSQYASILGGKGNDTFFNGYLLDSDGSYSTIDGGDGADSIENYASNVTIVGGAGNDTVTLGSNALYNVISYASGDGNDVIYGFDSNDTVKISSGTYTTQKSGSDTIIKVGSDSITVKNNINVKISGNKGGGGEDPIAPDPIDPIIDSDSVSINGAGTIAKLKKTYTSDAFDASEYEEYENLKKINASALKKGIAITGNENNNSIVGGKGADTLCGYEGNNTLKGGTGKDVFVYVNGSSKDVITDYKAGQDAILIDVEFESVIVKGKNLIFNTYDDEGTLTIKNGKNNKIKFINEDGEIISNDKYTKSMEFEVNDDDDDYDDYGFEEHWFLEDNNFVTTNADSILQADLSTIMNFDSNIIADNNYNNIINKLAKDNKFTDLAYAQLEKK